MKDNHIACLEMYQISKNPTFSIPKKWRQSHSTTSNYCYNSEELYLLTVDNNTIWEHKKLHPKTRDQSTGFSQSAKGVYSTVIIVELRKYFYYAWKFPLSLYTNLIINHLSK